MFGQDACGLCTTAYRLRLIMRLASIMYPEFPSKLIQGIVTWHLLWLPITQGAMCGWAAMKRQAAEKPSDRDPEKRNVLKGELVCRL